MNIVVLDGYTLNPGDLSWNELEKLGDVIVYDRTPDNLILERINGAEIVLTNKTILTKDILNKSYNLKYIGVLATGYDVVDIQFAREKGIIVTNIPSYATKAVGQFTIALLLEVCHHVGEHNKAVKNGEWSEHKDFSFWNYPLIELYGKTLGIIGYGRIGQTTGKIAQALGMSILAYDSNDNNKIEGTNCKLVNLDQLFKESDVITLHCPLTTMTEKIINKYSILKMKDGVIILNTSRGGLINEKDLSEALISRKVKAFACDVVSSEPIQNDNPLLNNKNTIITPHIAWAPIESRQRLMNIAIDNIRSNLKGKPMNVV